MQKQLSSESVQTLNDNNLKSVLGGTEVMIHATRRLLENLPETSFSFEINLFLLCSIASLKM